jgi:outer membrane protein OmpA-like peptidoglycan-associated protein
MKKLLFAFTAILGCLQASFGQNSDYVKRPALGVHFFFDDFKGAAYIRQYSLTAALRDKQLMKFKSMSPGLAVNYINGLSKHIDFSSTLAGSFVDYPIPGHTPFGNDNFLLEGDASVNAKLLSDRYWVTPFLSAGLGGSMYKNIFGAFLPLGAGLQVNLFDDAFLLVNSQYRVPVTGNTAYHFYHSIGFAGNIGKKREPKPIPVPLPPAVIPPKDTDGDGVVDSLDACPTEAGLASLNGCPDRDKDGIADKDDKCPDVAGLARYQGCPIPDRDNDGINDEEDKCPDVAGVARYQGCPIPDRDNDGVNDEEDKCPDIPGVASNNGCPEVKAEDVKKVEYAAKNIFFATGKYTLLSKSFKSLNSVAQVLKDNKDLKLNIDGYTDNTGKADKNQGLSQHRADAVMKYLIDKGVGENRLTSVGHGPDSPVADNKTATGRAKNRRVELHLKYY